MSSPTTLDGNLDEELTLKLDTSTQREGLTILRQKGEGQQRNRTTREYSTVYRVSGIGAEDRMFRCQIVIWALTAFRSLKSLRSIVAPSRRRSPYTCYRVSLPIRHSFGCCALGRGAPMEESDHSTLNKSKRRLLGAR